MFEEQSQKSHALEDYFWPFGISSSLFIFWKTMSCILDFFLSLNTRTEVGMSSGNKVMHKLLREEWTAQEEDHKAKTTDSPSWEELCLYQSK